MIDSFGNVSRTTMNFKGTVSRTYWKKLGLPIFPKLPGIVFRTTWAF
jgi:hypothetical protein